MELTEEQRVEYNTVVLGGLLHDIGKFFNRLWKVWMRHPLASVKFIERPNIMNILQKDGMNIDVELLKSLAQRHHEYYAFPGALKVQEIEDSRQRSLAYIVSRADSFSSKERDDEEERDWEFYKKYRTFSTFSLIDTSGQQKEDKYYQLREFAPETVFPMDKSALDRKTYAYEQLGETLDKELETFKPGNFTELFNGFWTIFKKYLWAVPSDTWRKRSDISLFDHLSTTSAIAACLYLYHKDNIDEKEITNDKTEKFLLVGGDLSGIQDFLFEILQRNPKKLSKTLRGRSFLLTLLVEITALKVLKTLDLPYSARLMSSGGRFIIMAPNREEVKEKLETLAREVEEEFFKTFLGKLTLNLDFSTTLSGKDLTLGLIKEKINQCNAGLILKKLNKNIHVLKNRNYEAILKEPHGRSIQEMKECSFCGVYPKEKEGEDERCLICNLSERLGEDILKKKFLHFTETSDVFEFLGIGIKLVDAYEPNLLSYALEERAEPEANHRGSIFYGIANYLPKDKEIIEEHNENENSLCYYCKRNDLQNEKEGCTVKDRKTFKESHLSFQCIASHTPFKREGKGVDKLAVFKADMDNLGYIVQYGFDREDEKEETERSIYSVSRYTFLSRMIDAFFQHWLKHTIQTKFPMIYTVYAGGDDLLLIGPWAEVVRFSQVFRETFESFVGGNGDITLSAGISLFSPHSPVTTAAETADAYLERSKALEGKNAVTLFDTTVKWEHLPELVEFADFLDNKVNDDDSKIKVTFLHRLFKYRRMFMAAEKEGIVEGLRFHSLMRYDVMRNIEQKKKDEVLNPEEVAKLRPLYVTGESLNKELLRNLNIPLYIALFKNRGGKQNER